MHIFIKLRALSIQQYDVVIMEKNKLQTANDDVENAIIEKSDVDDTAPSESPDIEMNKITAPIDIQKCEEELEKHRQSLKVLRKSNRYSIKRKNPSVLAQHITTVEYAEENINVLRTQLEALNMKPLEYIPLAKIREKLQLLTDAVNRGEIVDENEFDHLLRCMDVNAEYIQEQKEKERLWREQISTYAQECLIEQRRFIPPDIFVSTQTQLIDEKKIPATLAKRLMQKKCLWLIRMSEEYISKLHYAELQGKYSVEGNNLDIVETLAIYACVPVKLPNDGNGKKALWRKSLEQTVKKLMTAKENNILSASQLRNPAYKNHTGLFTSDELYDLERTSDMSNFSNNSITLDSYSFSSQSEVRSSINDDALPASVSDVTLITAKDKSTIKSQLQNIFDKNSRISNSVFSASHITKSTNKTHNDETCTNSELFNLDIFHGSDRKEVTWADFPDTSPSEVNNPMHSNMVFSAESSKKSTLDDITPMTVENKSNIKSKLENIFSSSGSSGNSKKPK
jgi:chaperonin cofactor prefoldin